MANGFVTAVVLDASNVNVEPPKSVSESSFIVGSSPTGILAGHAGELANSKNGVLTFTNKIAMKDMAFIKGGVLYSFDGTNLLPMATQAYVDAIAATIPSDVTTDLTPDQVVIGVDGTPHLTTIPAPPADDAWHNLQSKMPSIGGAPQFRYAP